MKLNTKEWDRVWPVYMQVSKRDLAETINTKLLFIAFGALARTPKADIVAMREELGVGIEQTHQRVRFLKSGKIKRGKVIQRDVFLKRGRAPLLALIINARRGREGKPGLYGSEMADAVRRLWIARKMSVAFLKSGWLPAIKTLLPLVPDRKGILYRDRSAKQRGAPKGYAVPANRNTWNPSGRIVNTASAERDHKAALIKYGGPALQAAFDYEVASMKVYIELKLAKSARRAGIRTR